MIVYFADRRMNVLGMAATGLPKGLRIHDDLKAEDVETGVATLEFILSYDEKTKEDAVRWADAGNFVLRSYRRDNEFYTIIDSEDDAGSKSIRIYAEDAGLDLLNETVGPFAPPATAQPIRWYVDRFAHDSGFEVGVNEIPNLTRTLSWEGHATATARLLSLATQFDNAEISFSFEIRNLSVERKLINIFRRRGQDDGVELRLNRELDNIITKKSVANLATALVVTGGTPEGSDRPITLQGHVFDDGNFHVVGGMLWSRTALAKWSRYLWGTGTCVGHIVQHFSFDTTNVIELRNRAVTHLQKISEPEINYEVDIAELPEHVRIGDTIYLVDGVGKLYLSARVLKLEISASNKTRKATLGDYLIQESGISTRVAQLAAQFEQLANSRPFFTWIAYADDAQGSNISLDPYDKKFMGIASNRLTVTPNLSDPSIFSWSLVRGADGQPVVIVNHGAMAVLIPSTSEGLVKEDKTIVIPFNAFRGGVRIACTVSLPRIPEGFFVISNVAATTTTDGRLELGVEEGSDLGGAAVSSGFFDVIFSAYNQEQPRIFAWSKNFPGSPGLSIPGVGIDNITPFFLVSNQETGILHSTPGWQLEPPPFTLTNRFLWTFERIVYTDATSEDMPPRLIGTYSRDGVGIRSTEIRYQAGNNGVTAPVGGTWTVNIPNVPQGMFLWTRIRITYTDNTMDTSFMVSRMGVDGTDGDDGVTLISSIVSYQSGTSGTIAPTGAWLVNIPDVPHGRFLWTRIVTTYSDGTVVTSFSVSRIPEDGRPGESGIFISETPPEEPSLNQLWQRFPGDPIRRWNGDEWVIHFLSAENLEVDSLSAISANMGTITAGLLTNADQTVIFNVTEGRLITTRRELHDTSAPVMEDIFTSRLTYGALILETFTNSLDAHTVYSRRIRTTFTTNVIFMHHNPMPLTETSPTTDPSVTGTILLGHHDGSVSFSGRTNSQTGFTVSRLNVSWISAAAQFTALSVMTNSGLLPIYPTAGQLHGVFSVPVPTGRFGCAAIDSSLAFFFGTADNISSNINAVQHILQLRTNGNVHVMGNRMVVETENTLYEGRLNSNIRFRIEGRISLLSWLFDVSNINDSTVGTPIIFRQVRNNFGFLIRQVTLLDADGHSLFPGRLRGLREGWLSLTVGGGFVAGAGFEDNGIRYQRAGNMVSVYVNNVRSNGVAKPIGSYTLATIPAGFRPGGAVSCSFTSGAEDRGRIVVSSTGVISINIDTNMGTRTGGIFGTVTYAVP